MADVAKKTALLQGNRQKYASDTKTQMQKQTDAIVSLKKENEKLREDLGGSGADYDMKRQAAAEQLKEEIEDDFTDEKERNAITKEIQRIQTRLNNYNNKFDWWKSNRDEELIKSYSAEPVASALGE